MTIDLASAVKAAKEIKAAIETMNGQRSELLDKKAALEAEVKAIYDAPLRRDEIKALIFETIDRKAASFIANANWEKLISEFALPTGARHPVGKGEPINLRDADVMAGTGDREGVFDFVSLGDFFNDPTKPGPISSGRAYFLFGDLIKGKIDQHFNRMLPSSSSPRRDWDRQLPIAKKRNAIERIESQIGELEESIRSIDAQLKELVDNSHVVEKPVYR